MRLVSAQVAWILLVPALSLAAPKKQPPAKKPPPAKKQPGAKPGDPAVDPATAPDPASEPKDPKDSKDGRTPPAAGAAGGGGGGGASAGAGAGGAAGEAKPDSKDSKDSKDAKDAKEAKAEPAAGEPPAAGADVDGLRQEYLALRDELFKSSARANAVASQLYSTRVQIHLTYTSGRYYTPVKSSIRLDGAAVYENADGAIAGDDGVRFDGYVAPGRHVVTFRVEAVGKDDDTFATVTESQVTVKAVGGKDLVVAAKARDGGDIAFEWKKKEKGSYGLGLDVAVKTTAHAEGGGAKGGGDAKPPKGPKK